MPDWTRISAPIEAEQDGGGLRRRIWMVRRYHFPGDMYSDAQWEWVSLKRAEGYSMRQLSTFLGLNTDAILTALRVRGLAPQERPTEPLNRDEFNALAEVDDAR